MSRPYTRRAGSFASRAGSRPCGGSAIGSSPSPELASALHRLRSALARLKAELELAAAEGAPLPAGALLGDLQEALERLAEVEGEALGIARVLVFDDDERLAELTARGLRRLGYDAESGSRFRAPGPRELVVFDLGLAARLSGPEREALKAARPIVVTGATDRVSRALAASLEAADYLVKPVEPDALAAAIRSRIGDEGAQAASR